MERVSEPTAEVVSGARLTPQARATAVGSRVLRWVRIPAGSLARRLGVLALVVLLQNALEFPRDGIAHTLGAPLTGVLVVACLAASLALLLAALRELPPSWRWLDGRAIQCVLLVVTLGASLVGAKQLVTASVAGFQPPQYPNDGTTLDHYAAEQLLAGHDPYVTTNIVAAVRTLHQDPARTTPLHVGAFASLPLTHPPSQALMRSIFGREPAGPQAPAPEFESHVSYPALAFLPLVPFVWAGFASVVPFFVLCFLALAALLIWSVPAEARLWVGLLLLADTPLLNAVAAGDLDIFYVLLLVVAWRWWQRPATSTLAFGLALAAKQIAWFYAPFYVVLIWRQRGWRQALLRLGVSALIFAGVNLPFVLMSPRAWLAGVLAPQVDPMFPGGNGLIRLSLAGLLPLAPSSVYTGIEILVFVACLVLFWRSGWQRPEMGFVLAVLPLFFAWRSLTTYFYFVAVPSGALLLAAMYPRSIGGGADGSTETAPLRFVPRVKGLWRRDARYSGGTRV